MWSIISINGVASDFKNMAATAAGRTAFITHAMNIVRQYQLHGIDMDREFPSTADGTDQTFTLLMKELSDSCHLGSSPHFLQHRTEIFLHFRRLNSYIHTI
jgi:chitinase